MRKTRFVGPLTAICALVLLLPAAAPAADDLFLELDGIQGESNDEQHVNAIDVHAFSWGLSAGRRGPAFQDLSLTKSVDRASPQLFLRAASGQAIPSALLIVRRAGEQQQDYLEYCLTGVQVTSVTTSASSGGSGPTESVTLSYATFHQSYRQQKPDGTLMGPLTAGWDLVKNLQLGGSPGC